MTPTPQLKPIDLKGIAKKYIYHWPLFLLGIAVTLSAAVLYLKIAKPTYEIRASILVKDVKKTNEDRSALQELDHSDEAKIAENEVEILSSRRLIDDVVNQLQLWVSYSVKDGLTEQSLYKTSPVEVTMVSAFNIKKPVTVKALINNSQSFSLTDKEGKSGKYQFNQVINSSFGSWKLVPKKNLSAYIGQEIIIAINDTLSTAEAFQGKLQVSLLNKLAPTIGLSINDKDIKRGKDFLNTLIYNYNNAETIAKNKLTASTINFIDRRLDSLTGELNHAEGAVEKYRSEKGLTDIESESRLYLENAQSNGAKLNDVNIQINVINNIEEYLNSQNSNSPPSTIGINDASLSSSIEHLSQLQLQKSKMLATTPEGNPIFDPINSQIKTLKSSISNTVSSIKSSLLATKRQLESFSAKTQSSIREVPGQERKLSSVKRQQKIKEDLYVYLLQKREELSLSYTATLADARIIDNAYEGNIVWPQRNPLLAIALFLGLLIPFFIIYLRENIKDKVLTKADIERPLKLPLLGELPADDTSEDGLIDQSVNSVISEHMRSIRTKLNFYFGDTGKSGKTILVTSSVSGEGKSFVSSNLSTSFAFLGRKTVLLEMDLRKPQIAKIFNLDTSKALGLTDYLSSDKVTITDIIRNSGYNENLDIIPSGTHINNPAELLDSERLVILLDSLKAEYENIIIDSSPLHLVTDALIISRLTNVTLYIVRQGITNKSELQFLSELCEQQELKNVKVIFNGVEQGRFGYGEHYNNSYYNAGPGFSFKRSVKKFASRF